MKTYSRTLAAGERVVLAVPGNFFHLLASSFPLDVDLLDISGRAIGEKAEAIDAGTWMENEPGQLFGQIVLQSAVAQQVKIAVAFGRAGVFRVSGEVSVIDGAKARVLSGVSFSGVGAQAAVAAQFSLVQLWNKSVNKLLVVSRIIASQTAGVAGVSLGLRRHNAALTALFSLPESKLIGAAVSASAEVRSQSSAAVPGTLMTSVYVDATPFVSFSPSEPYLIPPGFGLIVSHSAVNSILNAQFDHWEESI